MKAEKNHATNELCLELKYCERCGGLWLRPVDGGQVYCLVCGPQMAELPPPKKAPGRVRVPRGPLRDPNSGDAGDFEASEEAPATAVGGAA